MPEKENDSIKITKLFVAKIDEPGWYRDSHLKGFCIRVRTEHDLRRTFETTAERLDISYYTLKRLLNHKTGSDPTAGYIVTSAERMREASQKVAGSLAASMGMPAPKQATGKLRRVQ